MTSQKCLITLILCVILIKVDSFVWYSSSFCQYRCSGGSRPAQSNQYYKTPNGCGTYGFQFEMKFYGINFNQCCYKHDLCYGSCNSGKQSCDQQLYSCAMDECNKCTNSVKYVTCKSIAKIMFQVTRTSGCTAYQRDQQLACSCS